MASTAVHQNTLRRFSQNTELFPPGPPSDLGLGHLPPAWLICLLGQMASQSVSRQGSLGGRCFNSDSTQERKCHGKEENVVGSSWPVGCGLAAGTDEVS